MITFENEQEAATQKIARALAPLLAPCDLLILSGDLGAGKTFFTRELLYGLGLPEHERVTSPTFTLIQEYQTSRRVMHADLYRLHAAEEVDELGLIEARQDGAVLVVEWGRPYEQQLGGGALFIELHTEPHRRLEMSGQGARAHELLDQLSTLTLGFTS